MMCFYYSLFSDTIQLQQAYERLTKVRRQADIRQTLMKCLCLSQCFPEVEDSGYSLYVNYGTIHKKVLE